MSSHHDATTPYRSDLDDGEQLVRDFQAAWQAGQSPSIEEFVRLASDGDREPLLRKLVVVDMQCRRALGEAATLSEYVARFPQLGRFEQHTVGYAQGAIDPNDDQWSLDQPNGESKGVRRRAAENLLFGLLGCQLQILDRMDLVRATSAWAKEKDRSLAEILLDEGRLDADDAALLWALVNKHVEKHGSLRRSLSVVNSDDLLLKELSALGDDDVSESLSHVTSNGSRTTTGLRSPIARVGEGGLRYVPLRPHARGGLGEVLVAYDNQLGREVALKEIQRRYADDHISRARFLLEGEITGGLEHPGVVSVYGLGIYPDGRPYYAMQLIKGESLEQAVNRSHKRTYSHQDEYLFELRLLLQRFKSVCQTIEYAHSRGVIHRDLKPSNIMLGRYGETLVIDWGLAKPLGRKEPQAASDEATLRPQSGHDTPDTMMGSAIGTPAYMSPEQARGSISEIGFASDIYSLGATLYAILTGRPPYTGNMAEKLAQATSGDFPAPREINPRVPKPLNAICLKAMALAPNMRYATCHALADDIDRWLAGETVQAYSEPAWMRMWRWARRYRAQVLSVSTVCLLVSLVLFTSWWRERARVARLQDDVRSKLNSARDLLRDDDLPTAQLRLTAVMAQVQDERRLAPQQQEAAELLADIETRLEEEKARAAAAARLTDFRRLRDEAIFHGTLLPGTDIEEHLESTLHAAREALALYDVACDAPDAPRGDRAYYRDDNWSEIEAGCYELVLIYASALARPRVGQSRSERLEAAKTACEIILATKSWAPPTRARHLRLAACFRIAERRTEEAFELSLARSRSPETALDHFLVGDSLLQEGHFSEALASFQDALILDSRHFWALYFSAVCLLELDRPAEAVAYLVAAESIRPFVWLSILRGYAMNRLGDYEGAEREFAAAIARDPHEYGVYVNRGAARLERGDHADAIDDLRRAVELKPNQYQAFLNLGEAHRRREEYDDALVALERALELAPRASKIYRSRGQVRSALGDLAGALDDFEQAIDLEPADSEARAACELECGKLFMQTERHELAVAALDRALSIEPSLAEVHWLRAEALLALGRNAESLLSLTAYLEHGSPEADVLRKRGFERSRQGEFAGAIADYTAALELEPDSAPTRARRGWALLNEASRLACDDFDRALQLEPDNPDLYCGRGLARVGIGEWRAGVDDAFRALNLVGDDDPPTLHFAVRYNSAAILALASARAEQELGTAEAAPLADEYHSRAVELLSEAFARFADPETRAATARHLLVTDEALAPLRPLPAFKQLCDELFGTR